MLGYEGGGLMKTLSPIGRESGEEGRSPNNFVLSMVYVVVHADKQVEE